MKLTAKQHLAEAEKDATECEQQLRAAILKTRHSKTAEKLALAWLLSPILEKQAEVARMIKKLLA